MTIIMNDVYMWLTGHELSGFGKTSSCFRGQQGEGLSMVVDDHRGCFKGNSVAAEGSNMLVYMRQVLTGIEKLRGSKGCRMMIPIESSMSDNSTALAISTFHDRTSFPKVLSWVRAYSAALLL